MQGARKILDHLKSGGLFFAAGLVAGVLNYGYQVLASRELSASEFAALNGWFANLAVFFFLAGILQYGSVFFPSKGPRLKLQLAAINLASFGFVWLWFALPPELSVERAIIILVTSTAYGWVMGQVQTRMAFGLLAGINFVQAALKVLIIAVPFFAGARLEAYALALFVTIVPSQLVASVALWRSETPVRPDRVSGWRSWIAPALLSCAVALMPQYDLVLMSHTQAATAFEEFARASLFYKGVYFVLFIVAQYLLPQQIHGKIEVRNLGLAVGFAAVASTVITLAAPFVGRVILKWDHEPSWWLILGSCLHMSLLTLAYLGIQQTCADGRVGLAALALVLLLAKGAAQWVIGLDVSTYLAVAIVLQIPFTLFLWKPGPGPTPRPVAKVS